MEVTPIIRIMHTCHCFRLAARKPETLISASVTASLHVSRTHSLHNFLIPSEIQVTIR